MKRLIKALVSISLIGSSLLFAGGDAGDYTFEYAPDAAAQGRGGGSAAELGSEAMYHNPAGIAFEEWSTLTLGRQVLEDFSFTAASYVHPFDYFGTFGVSFYSSSLTSVHTQYDQYGSVVGHDQGGDKQIALGYGYSFLDMFSVGTNVKMASQDIAGYSDFGVGLDFGLGYQWDRRVFVGVSIINVLAPEMVLVNTGDSYATVMKSGVATHLFDEALVVSGDFDVINIFGGEDALGNELTQSFRYRAGVSYAPIKWVALRGGLNDAWYNLGVGVNVSNFAVDYAYSWSNLSDDADIGVHPAHYVSLTYAISKPYEQEKQDLISRVKDLESQISLNKARESFISQNYAGAMEHIHEYLIIHPEDSSATIFKEEIRAEINKDNVIELEELFHSTVAEYKLVKSKGILDEIVDLSPQYEGLAAMQKKQVGMEQSEELLAQVKNLDIDESAVQIMDAVTQVLAIYSEHPLALELQEKAFPVYNKHKAKELYAKASSEFYEKKDIQKAHQILQEVLALDKDNEEAQKLHAELSGKLKDILMQQIAESGGDNQALLGQVVALDLDQQYLKANNLFEDKDYGAAEIELNKILRKDDKHEKALVLLDKVKSAAFIATAEKSYQEAVMAYNSNNMKSAFELVTKVLEINTEHEKAKELHQSMVQSTVSDIDTLFNQYLSSQDPAQLQAARDLLEALKENAISNEAIAKLLLNVETEENVLKVLTIIEDGKYDEADKALNNILLKNPDSKSANSAFEMLNELKEIMQ